MNILEKNEWNSKDDYERLLINICNKVTPYFSEGKALISLPNYRATAYEDIALNLESFARILWGIGPYSKHNNTHVVNLFQKGILNGTNPNHSEYWGDLQNYDQKAVEMVPIVLFLLFSKENFWDRITHEEKSGIEKWLLQCNNSKTGDNNWLLFSVLVNSVLKQLGAQYKKEAIDKNLSEIEKFYLGNGWYSDGESNRRDYYTSFSIHFYCLIYAKIMENDDKARATLYKKRAQEFASEFIYWFSEDGSSIPFGRSLTYRFAQAAFWSAIVFAEVDVFSLGIVKGIINRNLRWWLTKPIFDNDGLITVGYAYPNTNMSEDYNGTGSSYWALKIFLILALDKDHSFWGIKEEELPKLKHKAFQRQARMLICRKEAHVAAFVNGQDCDNQIHAVAKYEKFAYSNIFGFSVPRSDYGTIQGAYDSTIAVSEDGIIFKPKHNLTTFINEEDLFFSRWNPWNDVEIDSYILPGLPWHLRIHKIKTGRKIQLQDGGFSIERKSHLYPRVQRVSTEDKDRVSISYKNQHVGIVSLLGNGIPKIIFPSSNTSVLYPRTELPVLSWNLNEGNYIIINAVLGDIDEGRNIDNIWSDIPKIKVNNSKIEVYMNEYYQQIDLEMKYKIPSSLNRKAHEIIKQGKRLIRRIQKS